MNIIRYVALTKPGTFTPKDMGKHEWYEVDETIWDEIQKHLKELSREETVSYVRKNGRRISFSDVRWGAPMMIAAVLAELNN